MLKVIWGPRASGKTTALREAVAFARRPVIIPTTGYNNAKGKFQKSEQNEKISYLMKSQSWWDYNEIFIDDLEFAEREGVPIDGRLIRAAKENNINLTVTFSPMLIDMRWHILPLWWQALQKADEITELPSLMDAKTDEHYQTSIAWYDYHAQVKGEIVLHTKDGLFKLERLP